MGSGTKGADGVGGETKWSEEEVEMLHSALLNFTHDLKNISESIKQRTVSQINGALKKKALSEAGLPANAGSLLLQQKGPPPPVREEVTLNMLNAPDQEVDVEGGSSTSGVAPPAVAQHLEI